MANLYQLAEELEVSPKTLQKWLKSRGLGAGKTISSRAAREAKSHFSATDSHPMAGALEDRGGLGDVKRHEELLDLGSGVKVEERPQLRWGEVERNEVDVSQLDSSGRRDFFRQLRQGKEKVDPPPKKSEIEPIPSVPTTRSSKPSPKPKSRSMVKQPRHQPEVARGGAFGSLASMASQLDSMTDRPSSSTYASAVSDADVLKQLSDGVSPIKTKTSGISSKKGKRGKRGRKSKGAGRDRHPPVSQQKGIEVQSNFNEGSTSSGVETKGQVPISHEETFVSSQETGPISSHPQSFEELVDRPLIQSLQGQLEQARRELKELRKERDALGDQLKILEEADKQVSKPVDVAETSSEGQVSDPKLIWDHLSQFGLNVEQARMALLELLDHPQRGPELIYSLKHDQVDRISRGFAITCSAVQCQEVAEVFARQGLIELEESHLCTICQGSEGRGWYRRLLLTATHTERTKLLVVGGDDAEHHQIKQLSREYPGMSWDFIVGSSRIDQTTANAKVGHKSVVVLWGGAHLPHSLSSVIKTAAQKYNIPCFSLEPGMRSVALLCRGVMKSWGGDYVF